MKPKLTHGQATWRPTQAQKMAAAEAGIFFTEDASGLIIHTEHNGRPVTSTGQEWQSVLNLARFYGRQIRL